MPYGTIKIDTITFTDAGVDKSIAVSGLVQNPTFTGNVTVTGTVSGTTVRATTVSGVTVSGTTANFASGVYTTQISGAIVKVPAGTAGAPTVQVGTGASIAPGLYSPNTDELGISTGGSFRLVVDSTGRVGIGTSSPGNLNTTQVTSDNDGIRVQLQAAPVGGQGPRLIFGHSTNNGTQQIFAAIKSLMQGGNDVTWNSDLAFYTGGSSLAERARIDSSGRLLVGTSTARSSGTQTWLSQIEAVSGIGSPTVGLSIVRNQADIYGAYLSFAKTRGTSNGATTIVTSGDELGGILFSGADGSTLNSVGASIVAAVDGTPGVTDMPGRLVFSTTADGTATPTERMRIDSSGNVGIGTSLIYNRLAVYGTQATHPLLAATVGPLFAFNTTNNADTVGLQTALTIAREGKAGVSYGNHVNFNIGRYSQVGSTSNTQLTIRLTQGNANDPDTDVMTLLANGNVGIGTSSPSFTAHVSGAKNTTQLFVAAPLISAPNDFTQIGFGLTTTAFGAIRLGFDNPSAISNSYFSFFNNNGSGLQERMRITSTGDLLFQGTDPVINSGFYAVPGETGTTPVKAFALWEAGKVAISYPGQWRFLTSSGNTTAFKEGFYLHIRNYDVGSAAESGDLFQLRGNGGLANFSANNVNLSDRNAKKDISPAAGTWDCIKEWEIVNYRYKDQPDDADLNLGVIAQQVAESCPEVITIFQEAKEATDDTPAREERLGVKEQQMYWMTIKALQEAQVRIEQLEARLTAAGIN